jgi:hypothetical protein
MMQAAWRPGRGKRDLRKVPGRDGVNTMPGLPSQCGAHFREWVSRFTAGVLESALGVDSSCSDLFLLLF